MHTFGKAEEMFKTLVLFFKNGKAVQNTKFLRGLREPPRRRNRSLAYGCNNNTVLDKTWSQLLVVANK